MIRLVIALLCIGSIHAVKSINQSIDQSNDLQVDPPMLDVPVITRVSGCVDDGLITVDCQVNQPITIWGSWSIDQSTDQSINQLAKPPVSNQFYINIQSEYFVWGNLTQSTNQSISQSTSQSINQPTNQPTNQLVFFAPSIKESLLSILLNVQIRDSTGQWSDQYKGLMYQSMVQSSTGFASSSQPINPSTGQPTSQPINPSTGQPSSQPIDQSSSTGSESPTDRLVDWFTMKNIIIVSSVGGSVLLALIGCCCYRRSINRSINRANNQSAYQSNNRSTNQYQVNDMRRPMLTAPAQFGQFE